MFGYLNDEVLMDIVSERSQPRALDKPTAIYECLQRVLYKIRTSFYKLADERRIPSQDFAFLCISRPALPATSLLIERSRPIFALFEHSLRYWLQIRHISKVSFKEAG